MMKKMGGLFLALAAMAAAGCSDKSAMRFTIDTITGDNGTNIDKPYIEADLVGNALLDACSAIQDPAKITVRLEIPGTVGPSYEAYVKNVVIDYYYYDPDDGQLKGPVALLSSKQYNFNYRVDPGSQTSFTVPVVSFLVKVWSQGISCSGIPGVAGGIVDRMVARITVNAEDGTGKKMSSQGSIMIYLYNYGPGPVSGMPCFGFPTATMVAGLCSNP